MPPAYPLASLMASSKYMKSTWLSATAYDGADSINTSMKLSAISELLFNCIDSMKSLYNNFISRFAMRTYYLNSTDKQRTLPSHLPDIH